MSEYGTLFPAEWDDPVCILMALPHEETDWSYMLDEITENYAGIIEALTAAGEHVCLLCRNRERAEELIRPSLPGSLTFVECDFNDTWTRDYGPIGVTRHGSPRALDFGFNGWGLKFAADKDNLVNLYLAKKHVIIPDAYRNNRDFTLEGGSVESDGNGTVMTTTRCLCSPNRNGGRTKAELSEVLGRRLGASHILWLDHGALEGDDTDSHIDTLARLCPDDTIVFTGCRDMDDSHFEPLLKMRACLTMFRNPEGNPYNLVELPLPDPIYDENGERLPATYCNYLVTARNLFMPTYGQPHNDTLACQTIRIAFPSHNIVGIDCRQLIRQHGSLHCATMQMREGIINPAIYER